MRVKSFYRLIISYKASKFLLMVLLCIIGAFLVSRFGQADKNIQKTTAHVQKILLKMETNMDDFMKQVEISMRDSTSFTSIKSILEQFDFNSEIYSLFIYRNDSLFFWSDNKVPVSDFLNEDGFKAPFSKISNGLYDVRSASFSEYHFLGLIRIKSDYPYQNVHLQNQFAPCFDLDQAVILSQQKSKCNIYNSENDFLFSLKLQDSKQQSGPDLFLITLLYFLAYILIVVLVYVVYQNLNFTSNRKYLLLLAFITNILIFRFLTFYFHIPRILYESPLFSPAYFAVSEIIPSLGDLLANLILFFAIAFAIHKAIQFRNFEKKLTGMMRILSAAFILLINYFLFRYLINFFIELVVNSSVSYNLIHANLINIYSALGFLCMSIAIFIFFFLTFKTTFYLSNLFPRNASYLFFIVPGFALIFFIDMMIGQRIFALSIFFIYIVSFRLIGSSRSVDIRFTSTLFFIILFSLLITVVLYFTNRAKERENRKIIAQELAEQRDPMAEFNYRRAAEAIQHDSLVQRLPQNYLFTGDEDIEYLAEYLRNNYLTAYYGKYDILVTICDSAKLLNLQPDDYMVGCFDYFNDLKNQYGQATKSEGLYFIDYDLADDNYLGIIDVPDDSIPLKIFIEIFPKNVPKGLGYPELLIDKREKNSVNWALYSYARYENNELVYRYGKYNYSIYLDNYHEDIIGSAFFNRNGFNHLLIPVRKGSAIILSYENPDFLEMAAPFSYILIFNGLLAFLLFLFLKSPIHFRIKGMGLKSRIQLSITVLILFSFLFVGAASLFYIIKLNNNKNYTILSEKSHSALVELEHKLASEEELNPEMESYLSDLLYKFSLVFFTDLNLYDLNGTLLATSRPEIFNKGLISAKMNPLAFAELNNFKKSLLIHKEKIGDYKYLSAYIPFRNIDNKVIAYLNLPYFARQDELTNEISAFLVAYINIYVILIALAIFTILVISNYITKPIQMLKEKISSLKLGKTDEKIEWSKNDEIGGLVQEYNRKVDELARSAEMLAKSERESAWREMARQIAHEIKNPLTPMKLSVQYLQKAWDENAPDWDQRLKRFTRTIVEQIDSLSIIASEFSDFAKMPRSKFRVIDLGEVIASSISLYNDSTEISFEFNQKSAFVWADKEQLLRVFNNLIKNSIQAISDPQQGVIKINLKTIAGKHVVIFHDNGKGIQEDFQEKVFYPNFTTKSGGMGLGLAMVKSIIENAKGLIKFESHAGEGTTFTIMLPAYDE